MVHQFRLEQAERTAVQTWLPRVAGKYGGKEPNPNLQRDPKAKADYACPYRLMMDSGCHAGDGCFVAGMSGQTRPA